MRLLLVDDEDYTREGIMTAVPWKEIGIHSVEQAEDGLKGIEIAKTFKPDIVLADVRMPRMDGITMGFGIKELYPDCSIIFMSGYSDKEYLKSAIQLSAVSYIEKPINLNELYSTIKKAAMMQLQNEQNKKQRIEIMRKLDRCIPVMKNQIALKLIRKQSANELAQYLDIAISSDMKDKGYVTLLLKIVEDYTEFGGFTTTGMEKARKIAEAALTQEGFKVFTGIKDESFIVIHVCVEREHENIKESVRTRDLCEKLAGVLSMQCSYIITAGKVVKGLLNVYSSYETALVCMQKSFYYRPPAILLYENESPSGTKFDEASYVESFMVELRKGNLEKCISIVDDVVNDLRKLKNVPVNCIKAFFCSLLRETINSAEKRGISLFDSELGKDLMHETLFKFEFIEQIRDYVIDKIGLYYSSLQELSERNVNVESIEKFIEDNYSEANLSLSYIADKLKLSVSYMCVLFKRYRGKTINQHITEIRIEKAKEALKQDNATVKDIAESVGFNDCNYFIKVFKKETGFTPMEYRETVVL